MLDTERAHIWGAAFSPDGGRIALFGADRQLQTFEALTGQRLSVAQVAARIEELPPAARQFLRKRAWKSAHTELSERLADVEEPVRL